MPVKLRDVFKYQNHFWQVVKNADWLLRATLMAGALIGCTITNQESESWWHGLCKDSIMWLLKWKKLVKCNMTVFLTVISNINFPTYFHVHIFMTHQYFFCYTMWFLLERHKVHKRPFILMQKKSITKQRHQTAVQVLQVTFEWWSSDILTVQVWRQWRTNKLWVIFLCPELENTSNARIGSSVIW